MGAFLMRLVQFVVKAGAVSAFLNYLQKAVGGVFNSLTSSSSVSAIVRTIQTYLSKSPGGMMTILSAIGSAVGVDALQDYLSSDKGIAAVISGDIKVSNAIRSYQSLVAKYDFDPIEGPDGDADAIWGVDNDDADAMEGMLKDSMPMVGNLVHTFGTIEAAERVYLAFKMLEPRHFKLYRQMKAITN